MTNKTLLSNRTPSMEPVTVAESRSSFADILLFRNDDVFL